MNREATLPELIESFAQARVLVLGDPIYDVYHFGRVERISQEAPVPVFVEDEQDRRNGGALNVWTNVRSLGARSRYIWPCGHPPPGSVVSEKHRFMVGHHQIFRADDDIEHPSLSMDGLDEHLDWCHNVILADYGKGSLSEAFCQELIEACRKREKLVLVDPRGGNWEKYVGATVVFPNQDEWNAHRADRIRGTRPIFPYVVHKMGAQGMRLIVDGTLFRDFPARARQVFDVTGAGDTVIATFAAAVWNPNYSLIPAVELANIAAGVVVGKVGTSTVTQEELLQAVMEDFDGYAGRQQTRADKGEASRASAPREPGRTGDSEAVEEQRGGDSIFIEGGGAPTADQIREYLGRVGKG